MLALRLRRPAFGLYALVGGGLTPLPRVAQALSRQCEVALQPANLELRVAEPPLDFGAPRFAGVARLHAGLALPLGIAQARARRGERLRQLARAHAQRPQR